jgi:hypothetical protein
MSIGRTLEYVVLLTFWIVPASIGYAATAPLALRVSPRWRSLLRVLWRAIRSGPGADAYACHGCHYWSLASGHSSYIGLGGRYDRRRLSE